MNTKVCKQCGELKPIEQFRKYYGGRKGTYTMCKTCEKINSRAKYLTSKGDSKTDEEREELQKIYSLWDAQSAAGLNPPKQSDGKKSPLTEQLDQMIEKYKGKAAALVGSAVSSTSSAAPAELSKWLTEELDGDPEHYLDDVYEELKAKYRPVLRINKDTMEPVYDETYAQVLEDILDRFYEYEEVYYNK